MVQIGKFQLHYFLSEDRPKPDVWFEIESSDVTITSYGNSTKVESFPKSGGQLCELVGLKVEKASRRIDGGLLLELTGGYRLDVGIHAPNYESIVLHIGTDSIVG